MAEQSAAMPSPFPPIADYAFLSDCHTGALVASDGSVDWLCVPRFDAPSVFGSLLDRGAGTFRLGPFGTNVPAARHYEAGTNVLVTTWQTSSGWVVVRDALTMGPAPAPGESCVTPHTRPPADDDADHCLVRTAECLDGRVEMEIICEPVFNYGETAASWTLPEDNGHTADATGGDVTIRLQSDLSFGIEGERVRGRHVLQRGEKIYCSLSWATGLRGPADEDDAVARIERTVQFWRDWLGAARHPDHRFEQSIQRSALTVKGLTYMPTGATVAALTTTAAAT
jgi:GH15 family glucan-1,4-alpha-glucosidase